MEMEPPPARRRGAEDLISGLPDEILHCILLRLPSTAAAARTSLLSRRWRRVWAHMPELVLRCDGPPPAPSVLFDSVDAILNAYSAPTLRRLEIHMRVSGQWHIPTDRIARWLRFAARRLAGRLDLYLPRLEDDGDRELDLPVCERATEIQLFFHTNVVLWLPPAGSFTALTDLRVMLCTMNGRELGRLVSSQCPRLRKLVVLVNLTTDLDVSIRSQSLESLLYYANTGKLEIATPLLKKIALSIDAATTAYIVAPNLKKVHWRDNAYDPSHHQFAVVNRHLQRLWIKEASILLMRQFDTVNELRLDLSISQGTEAYQKFLKDTDKVPICEALEINLWTGHHAFKPTMLHLLGQWRCIRKLKFHVPCSPSMINHCMMLSCPCRLPESYRADSISFDSLEEIEIYNFTGSDEHEKFVKFLLSGCDAATLKSVEITMSYEFVSSSTKKVCKEIHSICHPNSKVKFNVMGKMGLEPFLF